MGRSVLMGLSGLAKSASTEAATEAACVRARLLRGRLDLGSAEVGIDSGMGSDIMVVVYLSSRTEKKEGACECTRVRGQEVGYRVGS